MFVSSIAELYSDGMKETPKAAAPATAGATSQLVYSDSKPITKAVFVPKYFWIPLRGRKRLFLESKKYSSSWLFM